MISQEFGRRPSDFCVSLTISTGSYSGRARRQSPPSFFPFGDTPARVAGQVAVEARWRRFFEEVRARRPGSPYLHLKPLDLRVDRYRDVGLVTFVLDRPSSVDGRQLPLQRRTLLFVRQHDAWKLAHMHASGASQP